MAWTYLAESDVSALPWSHGLGQSPSVKLTPIADRCLFPEWPIKSSIYARYGMTFTRLPEKKSVGPQIKNQKSFLAAFLANHSALPVLEKAWKTSEAIFFSRSYGSLKKWDQNLSFWKMSQVLGQKPENEWGENWPKAGTIVAGIVYPLMPFKWERLPRVSDGSCWPRPVAIDTGTRINKGGAQGRTGMDRPTCGAIAKMWPRPLASDSSGREYQTNRHTGEKIAALPGLANQWSRPAARDWKDGFCPNQHGRHSDSIGIQAQKTGHKGYLNPDFHIALIGMRPGWNVLNRVGMQCLFISIGKHSSRYFPVESEK